MKRPDVRGNPPKQYVVYPIEVSPDDAAAQDISSTPPSKPGECWLRTAARLRPDERTPGGCRSSFAEDVFTVVWQHLDSRKAIQRIS
jgi:hypothetical protein